MEIIVFVGGELENNKSFIIKREVGILVRFIIIFGGSIGIFVKVTFEELIL